MGSTAHGSGGSCSTEPAHHHRPVILRQGRLSARTVHITATALASFSPSLSRRQAVPSALEMTSSGTDEPHKLNTQGQLRLAGRAFSSLLRTSLDVSVPPGPFNLPSLRSFGPAHKADLGWGSERHPQLQLACLVPAQPSRAPSIDPLYAGHPPNAVPARKRWSVEPALLLLMIM